MTKRIAALVLAASVAVATAAHAQPRGHLALGVGVGYHNFQNDAINSTGLSIVPEYHVGLATNSHREGLSWGLKGGIGYSNMKRDQAIGGFETNSGSLRTVPVMVGVGPSYRTGPWRLGMGVVAGPSFNHFTTDDAARAAYRDRLGLTLNSIEAGNSLAVRPDMSVWYNITDMFGLHTSVSYTFNQPMVKTTVNGVTSESEWNLNRWNYQAGLTFGVF
jgi:hypothetical protein